MTAPTPPEADVQALGHQCDSGNFDRTICPEPCGSMHSYCDTCGKLQDYCPHEFASPEPTDQTREQIAEVLAEHRDRPCGHFAKGVKEWWSECEGCDWKDLATACDDCPIRFNEWRAGR